VEKGKATTTSSEVEEAWGILINLELIHADAFIASAILCRQGGETSTSMTEASLGTATGARALSDAK
jgi:hypothetical protein